MNKNETIIADNSKAHNWTRWCPYCDSVVSIWDDQVKVECPTCKKTFIVLLRIERTITMIKMEDAKYVTL